MGTRKRGKPKAKKPIAGNEESRIEEVTPTSDQQVESAVLEQERPKEEWEDGFQSEDEYGEWKEDDSGVKENDAPKKVRTVADVPPGSIVFQKKAELEEFFDRTGNAGLRFSARKNLYKSLRIYKMYDGFMYIDPRDKRLKVGMSEEGEAKLQKIKKKSKKSNQEDGPERRGRGGRVSKAELEQLSFRKLCSTLAVVVFACVILFAIITFTVYQLNPELLSLSFIRGYKDYYKILNVTRDVDDADLKRTYRKLAKEWHPDHHPNCMECEKKFALIAEANSVLSSPHRRKHFDEFGRDPGPMREEDRQPDFRPRSRAPFGRR